LHSDAPFSNPSSVNELSSSDQNQPIVAYLEQGNNGPLALKQVMLATAVVNLLNAYGQEVQCRAILDSGSQVCLITKQCASPLNISSIKISLSIAGIGSIATKTGSMINTTVSSRLNDFEASINFHAIDSITKKLPSYNVIVQQLNIPDTIINCLADPGFYKPGNNNVLLGAEIFYELLVGESKKTQAGTVLHNTRLGWVFTGSMPITNSQMYVSGLLIQGQSMSSLALTDHPTCSVKKDQSVSEVHFTNTVTQDPSGRFVVRLPLLRDPEVLGDSKFMAQQCFLNLERRMNRNPSLHLSSFLGI